MKRLKNKKNLALPLNADATLMSSSISPSSNTSNSLELIATIENSQISPVISPMMSLPPNSPSQKPINKEQSHRLVDSKADIVRKDSDMSEAEQSRLKLFADQRDSIGDIGDNDLETLGDIGSGNGGVVKKVRHIRTQLIMARKIIHSELMKPETKKQIVRELTILNQCNFPHIIGFYRAFESAGAISICMEYMDAGSLDLILKHARRIPEDILAKITLAVLKGLIYLREKLQIMHRDVKPSNILLNSSGEIKLCDFGVSGQLVNSMADTFVGTRSYMAPERLEGDGYSVKSDIWSIGLSLIELAIGIYPIPAPTNEDVDRIMNLNENEPIPQRKTMGIFELLECITNEPPPSLAHPSFSTDFTDAIDKCLVKDPKRRANLKTLMEHPWIKAANNKDVDIGGWICRTMNLSTSAPK